MQRFREVRVFTVTAASIRRVREAYGMTVAEFAQFVGVSTSTIVAWEGVASENGL